MVVNYRNYKKCDTDGCNQKVSGKRVTCMNCRREKNNLRQRIRWKNRKSERKEKIYMGHLNQ